MQQAFTTYLSVFLVGTLTSACTAGMGASIASEESAQNSGFPSGILPQECDTLPSGTAVTKSVVVLETSDAFSLKGPILFDYADSFAYGEGPRRGAGVQLEALDAQNELIEEGLSVRLVARYCNGGVRTATISEPYNAGWTRALYSAKFDQEVVPLRAPALWELTVSWNEERHAYLLPAVQDFWIKHEPTIGEFSWKGNDPLVHTVLADIDSLPVNQDTGEDAYPIRELEDDTAYFIEEIEQSGEYRFSIQKLATIFVSNHPELDSFSLYTRRDIQIAID